MKKAKKDPNKLTETMISVLMPLQELCNEDHDLSEISVFLIGVISTCADLMELKHPGVATQYIYTEIEAAMKLGGLRSIRDHQIKNGSSHYSVANIAPDDLETAMNYVGQELGITLFKVIHEIPLPLRGKEILLRGIEALLANVLHGKFSEDQPHKLLDSICEHVHLGLKDLETRIKKFPERVKVNKTEQI